MVKKKKKKVVKKTEETKREECPDGYYYDYVHKECIQEPTSGPEPTLIEPSLTLGDIVILFPEPMMAPTQRQYGEMFYPRYKRALAKLKQFANK